MYVLALELPPESLAPLAAACTRLGLPLETAAAGEPAVPRGDLLAAFYQIRAGGPAPVPAPEEVRRHGAAPVVLLRELTGAAFLDEVWRGFRLVLPAPPGADRLTRCLSYLRDVAPPPGSQQLWLDDSNVLSSTVGSTRLSHAEAVALRRLCEAPGRIVSREDLAAVGALDVLRVTTQLKDKLAGIGSGAQLLKVPHMGFRFVGKLALRVPGDAGPDGAGARR
jgi:hypothetical protein